MGSMDDTRFQMEQEMADWASPGELGIDFKTNPEAMSPVKNFTATVAQGVQGTLRVEFFKKRIPNKRESTDTEIKWLERDYIRIYEPGRDYYKVERRVKKFDAMLYPRQWHLYKAGKDQNQGTSLTTMVSQGLINESHLSTLNYLGIQTVEQLAAIDDASLPSIGLDGDAVRRYARGFLAHIARIKQEGELAATKKRIEELEKRLNVESEVKKEAAKEELAEEGSSEVQFVDLPPELVEAAKAKRGRPKKSPIAST